MASKRKASGGNKPGKDKPGKTSEVATASSSASSGESKKPSCFVISPIGIPKSRENTHANKVCKDIIFPVAEELGFDVGRIDHNAQGSASLPDAIVVQLCEAHLVIAVLTYLNSNVMYELGIRHAHCLPVIHMAEEGTSLPFNIQAINTVFYSLRPKGGVQAARDRLRSEVKEVIADLHHVFSPPDPKSGIFAKKLWERGKYREFDAVFKTKVNVLIALRQRLVGIKQEMENDFEKGKTGVKPLPEFAPRIIAEFTELRDKVGLCETIALDQQDSSAKERCLQVLGQMKRLQADGNALAAFLESATSSKKSFEKACAWLDDLISTTWEIQNAC